MALNGPKRRVLARAVSGQGDKEIVHDFVPMREQGGVSSQGTAGSGAFVAYEFIAKAASLKVRPRTRGALNAARGAVY